MAPVPFSAANFLHLGLLSMGFSEKTIERTGLTTNTERFRDYYYVHPDTCEIMFHDMQLTGAQLAPKRFLMALYYLKKYPTKHGLAAFLDETEKTALKWVHAYVALIQGQKDNKVRSVISPSQPG